MDGICYPFGVYTIIGLGPVGQRAHDVRITDFTPSVFKIEPDTRYTQNEITFDVAPKSIIIVDDAQEISWSFEEVFDVVEYDWVKSIHGVYPCSLFFGYFVRTLGVESLFDVDWTLTPSYIPVGDEKYIELEVRTKALKDLDAAWITLNIPIETDFATVEISNVSEGARLLEADFNGVDVYHLEKIEENVAAGSQMSLEIGLLISATKAGDLELIIPGEKVEGWYLQKTSGFVKGLRRDNLIWQPIAYEAEGFSPVKYEETYQYSYLPQICVEVMGAETSREWPIQSLALIVALIVIGIAIGAAAIWLKIKPKKPFDYVCMALSEDERKIVKLTADADGRIRQDALVKGTGFSASKVSQLVLELEGKGLVKREPYGRTNMIILREELKS